MILVSKGRDGSMHKDLRELLGLAGRWLDAGYDAVFSGGHWPGLKNTRSSSPSQISVPTFL